MLCFGWLTTLFFLLLVVELCGETIQNYIIIWVVKPLLMPVLLVLFLLNGRKHLLIERICLCLVLVFSCLGDILFMLNRDNLFLPGLAVYFIVHISYVISFLVRIRHEGDAFRRRLTLSTMIFTSIPFLIYATLFLYFIYSKLKTKMEEPIGLFLPVIVYAFTIVGMGYVSSLRDRKVPGYWCVLVGAILFITSDSLLAFNKFIAPIPLSSLPVMFTYGIGQYLITIGILKFTESNPQIT